MKEVPHKTSLKILKNTSDEIFSKEDKEHGNQSLDSLEVDWILFFLNEYKKKIFKKSKILIEIQIISKT